MTTTTTNRIQCLHCSGTGVDASFGDQCAPCTGTGWKRTAGTGPDRSTTGCATDKQVSFYGKLVAEAIDLMPHMKPELTARLEQFPSLDRKAASRAIDAALTALKAQRTVARAVRTASTPQAELSVGMYLVGDDVVKVQRSRESGNLYAKVLDPNTGKFEYVAGAVRRVRPEHRMSMDMAVSYGRRTGNCCVCSRTLTNTTSIEAGIGPICAGRL